MNQRSVIRRLAVWPASFGLALLFGCAGGQFGSELSTHPQPRAFSAAEAVTVRLPEEQPFNIHLYQITRQPLLDGQAAADADARADGTATATANVTNGGTAEAVFQVGHAIQNTSDRQTDLDLRFQFDYELRAEASTTEKLPDATVGLRLYARQVRGPLVRDIPLVTYTTENGRAKRRASQQMETTVTLGPGDTVEVFLAGQARVEVPDGRSATSELKLAKLRCEVVSRPAPAVRTTSDAQP